VDHRSQPGTLILNARLVVDLVPNIVVQRGYNNGHSNSSDIMVGVGCIAIVYFDMCVGLSKFVLDFCEGNFPE